MAKNNPIIYCWEPCSTSIARISLPHPFGMLMPERSYSSGGYRYGFNSQEKDDEVAGSGNINTAEYWDYDCRLGRRWNIDPVENKWESPYSCFLANPIIYVDPLGNTDYYNLKGEQIGTDGNKEGGKHFILSDETEKDIIAGMQKDGKYVLNDEQLKNTVPVPSEPVLKKMDETFDKTQKADNTREYGFVVGTKDGEQEASNVNEGTEGTATAPPKVSPSVGSVELSKKGVIPNYVVHSHPNVLRYNKGKDSYSGVEAGSSSDDRSGNLSSKNADIVLEDKPSQNYPTSDDKSKAKANPGKWIRRGGSSDRVITFYNQSKNLKTMKYDDFKKVAEKINKPKK